MKKHIFPTLLIFFNLFRPIISMEAQASARAKESNVLIFSIPTELLSIILKEAFFNLDILSECQDIHQALEIVKPYASNSLINILTTCKTFFLAKDYLMNHKKEFRGFYQEHLKKIFLENRSYLSNFKAKKNTSIRGLFPKNSSWDTNIYANEMIAKFMLEDDHAQNPIIINLLTLEKVANLEKHISLVLFFDANLHLGTPGMPSPLIAAVETGNPNIMKMLLAKSANTDLKYLHSAIYLATREGSPEIVAILKDHLTRIKLKDNTKQEIHNPQKNFCMIN